MDSLINGLNTRFNIVIQSNSDNEFYLNLYQYFDFVLKNQTLKNIVDDSEREYYKSFSQIRGERREYTEEELDVKSAQVAKLERFNMYAIGCTILMRIYYPLQHYKEEAPEPDPRPDPVVHLMLYGFDRTLKLKQWSKDYLKSYNWWFEGKRGMYEQELRRFHLAMLEKLEQPQKENEKEVVLTLASNGDVVIFGSHGNISPTKREYKLLYRLVSKNGENVSHKEIARLVYKKKDTEVLRLEMPDLVRKLKNLLKEISKEDISKLVKNSRNLGYRLNLQENQEAKLLP